MKIFQTIQKKLANVGFARDQNALNRTQLEFIFKGYFLFFLFGMYPLRVASAPNEYLDWIFMSTSGILIYLSYMSIIFEMRTIFRFIDGAEEAINES